MTTDNIEVARLREAAKAALENIQGIMDGNDIPSVVVRDMLRVALAPCAGISLIQCADCLAWINKDASHSCKQQAKANRRRGARN